MKELNIAGISVKLIPINDDLLRDVPINLYVGFWFYEGSFKDIKMWFLQSKDSYTALTPAKYRKLATKMTAMFSIPIVFIFENIQPIVRRRMVEQGVYFVISGKYAYLPNLFINRVESNVPTKVRQVLSPTGQYIWLYYLQHKDCRFSTIREIQDHTPFSYLQIARAITDLEAFNLCQSEYLPPKKKRIQFIPRSRNSWNQSLPFLRNPITKIIYTDADINLADTAKISGINALAHYTDLNQIRQQALAMSKDTCKLLELRGIPTNPIDGKTELQDWIYPPSILGGEYADPLSLWLTLRENTNPRTQAALDQIIDDMTW